jgi:GLPGLI family protein
MKKLLFFCCAFLCSMQMFSQNYQAEYAEFGSLNHGRASLLFNSQSWLYKMSYEDEIKISSDGNQMQQADDDNKFVIHRFNYYSLDGKYFLWEEKILTEKCVIKEKLEDLNWKIYNDSTKVIGGYNCILAQCDLCGWDVKAWFTPDIPVSCGPWRLWGLPGLIVNAYSADGDIDIQMTSLKKTDLAPAQPDISKYKVIAKSEYAALLEQNAQKMARIMNSRQDNREGTTTFSVKTILPDKCLR